MKKTYLLLPLITIILLFTSCTKQIGNYFSNSKDPKNTDFNNLVYDLTKPICKKIKKDTILYITDYVNEKNLKNKSQLGFLLSNQTKVNVLDSSCTKNVKIQDLQLAKKLKISSFGSRILSRDINEIKNTNLKDDKQILIGTYIITKNKLITFLKLTNLKNGEIISTSSTSRLLNDEIRSLEGIITNEQLKKNEEINIYKPMHL